LPEDLRQTIDKQRQFENEISSNELVAFPIISHVGIKNIVGVDVIDSWKNSHIKLKNVDEHNENVKNFSTTTLFRGCLTDCYVNNGNSLQYQQTTNKNEKGAIKNLKEIVQQLKTEYGDFPTNRCFKQLHWKFKSFSKNSLSASDENSENFLYVDVLKPMKSEEFLINSKPAKELFNFLQTFNEKSESFEDFTDDSNSSRFSVRGSNNFVVLTGDNGVGKTSSVYAVTSDLNYRVIEVNAGSRRSGKIMLQELLEATQSHRVQTNNNNDNTQDSTSSQSQTSNEDKKSVILIEDAELVFESDDGFVSSIQQLINISKRPVILTTNNRNCQHLQKFINHNEIAYTMTDDDENRIGKYLSLLCLAANYRIDSIDIQHLFTSNRRDMRKTINEIEFFIRSRVTTKTTTTAKFFDDDDDDDDLLEFYLKDRRSATMRINQNHSNDDISSIHFDSSIMSSMLMPKSAKFDDEKKDELMDEMKCYILENTHSHMLKSKYNLNESIYKVTER
jgi:nucleoside-triphosphatase THEP1